MSKTLTTATERTYHHAAIKHPYDIVH